jgi:hypothetical protein
MVMLRKRNLFEKRKSFNGRCSYGRLSQQRGPPHLSVVDFVAVQNLAVPQAPHDATKAAKQILSSAPMSGALLIRYGSVSVY